MERTLKFINTYTVAEFKELFGVVKIDIIKNPHTSKLFFTCNSKDLGSKSGPVSDDYATNPAISLVEGDDKEQFYIIHKKGSAENTVASL